MSFTASCVVPCAALALVLATNSPRLASAQDRSQASSQAQQATEPPYDQAIFQNRIPADQLAFLNQFAGWTAKDVLRDKQFRKLIKSVIPDCEFHYGRDKPLTYALDEVFDGSTEPVLIHDGRYFLLAGHQGQYLAGRGFLWFDLKDGVFLGGFYFTPTNGEPTPSLVIFSQQVKERLLKMSQLPQAFSEDLYHWSQAYRVSPTTTRYFITGSKKRILLEHDEDYCLSANGTAAPDGDVCEQLNADVADVDLNAAYYLQQINYATNGTAWQLNPEQITWIGVRNNTCGGGPNPLACRIHMTRERTRVIIGRPPGHR
jgi:uncharacterized protein YecT (DUF1311 family)